jgi:hypothetical protein
MPCFGFEDLRAAIAVPVISDEVVRANARLVSLEPLKQKELIRVTEVIELYCSRYH